MRTTERPDAGANSDPVARGRDVNIRAIFRFGFWLAVGVVAVTLAMLAFFRVLEKRDRASDIVLSPSPSRSRPASGCGPRKTRS